MPTGGGTIDGSNDLGGDRIAHGDVNAAETPQERVEEPTELKPTDVEPEPNKTPQPPENQSPSDHIPQSADHPQASERQPLPVNSKGEPYPTVIDPHTEEPIPFPEGALEKVPKEIRKIKHKEKLCGAN